jgi:hypothetical protein
MKYERNIDNYYVDCVKPVMQFRFAGREILTELFNKHPKPHAYRTDWVYTVWVCSLLLTELCRFVYVKFSLRLLNHNIQVDLFVYTHEQERTRMYLIYLFNYFDACACYKGKSAKSRIRNADYQNLETNVT